MDPKRPNQPPAVVQHLLVNWACPSSLRRAASCSLALFAEFSPGLVTGGSGHLWKVSVLGVDVIISCYGEINNLRFHDFGLIIPCFFFFRFVFLVCFGDVRNRKNV